MFEDVDAALQKRDAKSVQLSVFRRLALAAGVAAAALTLAAAGRGMVVEPVVVPTGSMVPTIPVGGRVLVVSDSLFRDQPTRGDIITFVPPGDPNKRLVKRIVGLEGETIATRAGVVTVNGKPLDEPWLDPGVLTTGLTETVVPPGHYFVLGDARAVSLDSRVFGSVPTRGVGGRAGAVLVPARDASLLS